MAENISITTGTERNSTRRFGLSSFVLHLLAMGFMLCDHLWGTFLGHIELLGYIGRLAFPIFAFMLVEGFHHTSSRKKYALRLLIFALVSEIPFNLCVGRSFFYPLHQNVLWTFLMALGMMCLFERTERIRSMVLRVPVLAAEILFFYLLGIITFVDYYGYGSLIVSVFYFTRIGDRKNMPKWVMPVVMAVQTALLYYINVEMIKGLEFPVVLFGQEYMITQQGLALLALPFIWLYNGQRGYSSKAVKYAFYIFYPLHLFILGGLITWL